MLLYLVRHGETDLNAQGVYQGHLPTPLNAAGRQQAEKLREALRGVPFKECWTSHLPRAAETAKIVLGPYHPKTSLQLHPLLADRAMGELEGKAWVENPQKYARAGGIGDASPSSGVESDEALTARLHEFLDSLIQTHTPLTSPLSSPRMPVFPSDPGSGTVLVVTHEACLLALLQILTDSSAKEYFPVSSAVTTGAGDGGTTPSTPSTPTFPMTPGTAAARKRLIDMRIPLGVDVGAQCANTAVCVVRVWWEDGQAAWPSKLGLEAKGRVEMWGDVAHLDGDKE